MLTDVKNSFLTSLSQSIAELRLSLGIVYVYTPASQIVHPFSEMGKHPISECYILLTSYLAFCVG